MSDIWDKVSDALDSDIRVALGDIRNTPEFISMGSEIERALAAHFVLGSRIHGGNLPLMGIPTEASDGYFLAPQVHIGEYRVDFLFGERRNFDKWMKCVVIECDGHAFHEKTKEQAARDKARDRFLSTKVGRVIRFSGSEIYQNSAYCWMEVAKVHRAASDSGQ